MYFDTRAQAERRHESRPSRAFWLVLGAALSLLACQAGQREPVWRHVVLITVDTWRGDHFGGEVAGVELTPHLARLAGRSIRFAKASSVAAVTTSGVAGILTGLLPERSGVVVNDHKLPPTLPTLATLLAEEGFETGAFVANPVLNPGYGFENGFQHYEPVRRERPFRKAKADAVNRAALTWLDGISPEASRILLWVHYMEPHGPYEPPPEHLALFPLEAFDAETDIPLLPEGRNGGGGGIPHYQQIGALPASTDGREYMRRYAAEVHFLDEQIDRLLDELERRGILSRAALVLAADHGEALAGDQGFYFSHDNGLTEDQIWVPLMLYYPGCEGGRVIEQPVSNIDILPTLLDLSGIARPGNLDGSTLLGEPPQHVFSQTDREQSVREGAWKLRVSKRSGNLVLTDLSTDPRERRDFSAEHAEVRDRLRAALARLRQKPALAPSIRREPVNADQRERLKALGYL